MTGIGKWQGSVKTIFFTGDVVFTIADNAGEYDIVVQLPSPFEEAKFTFHDIAADGNTLTGKGEISILAGREIDAEINFDGDEMSGALKIPFIGKIKIKDGKRIG